VKPTKKAPTRDDVLRYLNDLLHGEMDVYGGELSHRDRLLALQVAQMIALNDRMDKAVRALEETAGVHRGI
jgi:hypothetical protein